MQLFFDEPKCFKATKPHYGNFVGARNYLAIVGKKAPDLDERAGYYGEKLVLLAQSIGLNSCWVALTHGKTKAVIGQGEKLVIVVSLGYGQTQGVQHKSKDVEALSAVSGSMPDWFKTGMEAAQLSPTAMNQQKFLISWDGKRLLAKVKGLGAYTKVDLGIVTEDGHCPVTPLLLMLQGRWKSRLMYEMCIYDTVRFGQLKKDLPGITNTMLTKGLRELEDDGLISRKQFNEIPPHVEYSLTEMGRDLLPVFYAIMNWGFKYDKELYGDTADK